MTMRNYHKRGTSVIQTHFTFSTIDQARVFNDLYFVCGRSNCTKAYSTEKKLIRHRKKSKRCKPVEASKERKRRSPSYNASTSIKRVNVKQDGDCKASTVDSSTQTDALSDVQFVDNCPICSDIISSNQESVRSCQCLNVMHRTCYNELMLNHYKTQILMYQDHSDDKVKKTKIRRSRHVLVVQDLDFFEFKMDPTCPLCRSEFVL